MSWADLADETKDGIIYGMRLAARKPRQSTLDYRAAVEAARVHALTLTQDELIAELKANMPSYIEELLRTEDERFGPGALASRYAHTFWKNHLAKREECSN